MWKMVFARCSFECRFEVWKVNTQSKHNLHKKISKHLIEFRSPEFWMLFPCFALQNPWKSILLWGWCKLLRLRRHLSLCGWYGKHCLKGSCFLVQLHRWWLCAVQRWKSRYPHAIRMISLYSGIEIEGSAHMPRSEIIKGISYGRRPQMQTAFGIRIDTLWLYSVHGHLKNSAWQVVDVLNI